MDNTNFLQKLVLIETLLTKLDLKPDSILTVQTGIIVDTNDNAQLGRVKVKLDTRGDNSTRWSYFLGYPSGQVPAEYVRNGTRVACIPTYGNANEMLIIGTFGSGSSPNPVSLPIISIDDQAPLPLCNTKSLGQLVLLENKNGSDVNICIRSGSSYSWRKLHSSLITESQGYTTEQLKKFKDGIASKTLFQDSQAFSVLPPCDETKQGQIIPFSERDEWRQFNIICNKNENGDFKWKPASTIPIFTRNSIPNPTEDYHGTLIQIDDGANSYLAYCARENGEMKWMKYGVREAITFNNVTKNDRPNNKSRNSEPALTNPSEDSIGATSENKDSNTPSEDIPISNINEIIEAISKGAGLVDKSLFDLKNAWSSEIAKSLGISSEEVINGINSGLDLLGGLNIDSIPEGAPTEIKNILNSKNPTSQIIKSTSKVIAKQTSPEISAVLYGVSNGGWQGALDAATTFGLNSLPEEFRGSFSDFLKKKGGIENLPGPLKDIANSALGNINIGLKDVSKQILNGSLIKELSSANFDLSKLDLSINPDNIGSFLNTMLPGNIDLTNLSLNASDISKTISGVLDFAGLGSEFSSIFSGGLGAEFAQVIVGNIGEIFGSTEDPCSCQKRKCTSFKDKIEDNKSLYEDCKTVMKGATTYGINLPPNDNEIANGMGHSPSGIGEEILPASLVKVLPIFFGGAEAYIDATSAIKQTQVNSLDAAIRNGIESKPDFLQFMQELRYTGETTSKVLKVIDNNITQLEITDRQVIDGILAIIKEIFGCGLPGGGLLNDINGVIQDFMSITSTLAAITNVINSITNGGLGSDIQTVIDTISSLSNKLGGINNRVSSVACQIKADFIQPAKDLNTVLGPGDPAGSGNTPFTTEELGRTVNNSENLSKENLISSVFDGIPYPRIDSLPNRVQTLSQYPNKDIIESILNEVFNDPAGVPQVFPEVPQPNENENTIENLLNRLNKNEESGRFEGEKDCR